MIQLSTPGLFSVGLSAVLLLFIEYSEYPLKEHIVTIANKPTLVDDIKEPLMDVGSVHLAPIR